MRGRCLQIGRYKKNVCYPTQRRKCSAAIVSATISATMVRKKALGKDINCKAAKVVLKKGFMEMAEEAPGNVTP